MYNRPDGERRHVLTSSGAANLQVHRVGPHPILRHFLERMTFARIVGSCLGTPREGLLTHAQTLSVLVQNIILSPAPLYRMAEWASPISPAALGLSPQEKLSINDDRVARSLDALSSSQARSLFFRLALNVIKKFELDTSRIHHDTTSVTFHGRYEGSHADPQITHGLSKDHRPDLKQLVFGLNVTADGAVPVSHEVFSGNRTDDTIHRGNLEQLRQLLGRDDFIYVADCKLATRKNLQYIDGYGGKFVTVLPRTRAEDQLFRRQLREGKRVRWRQFLVVPNKRRKRDPPNSYCTTADGPNLTNEGYRIVWCRSSQKAQLDALAREGALKRAQAELIHLASQINRGSLRRRSSIAKKAKTILRKLDCERFLRVTVHAQVRIQTKHLRRGRPKKDDAIREVRSSVFRLEVKRDTEALRAESRTDGVFPLTTNLQPRRASKQEVLLIYKYQPYVEKRHALFKTELEVAPVYLKKPRRAVGLLHATYLAMTVDALIERTVRQAMKRLGLESLPILPEGRLTKTPTTARLLEMFTNVAWYEFDRAGDAVTFPIQLSTLQKQLLRLLDMDPSTYA